VGSVIGRVVSSIVGPMFQDVISEVTSLTDVSGSATVPVTGPSSGSGSGCDNAGKASSTPEPSKQKTASCLVGAWTATNVTMSVTGGATLSGLAGATWTFDASGKTIEDYNGSADIGGAPYAGIETATFVLPPASQTSGQLLESAVDGGSITIAGHPEPVTTFHNANGVGSAIGTYSCSATALTLKIIGFIPQSWSFVRAAG
jgi:hypothetical protein